MWVGGRFLGGGGPCEWLQLQGAVLVCGPVHAVPERCESDSKLWRCAPAGDVHRLLGKLQRQGGREMVRGKRQGCRGGGLAAPHGCRECRGAGRRR